MSLQRSLNGEVIVVTGALGGIGSAVIHLLSDLGARVIAVDRLDQESGAQLIAKMKNVAISYEQVDLTDSKQIAALMERIAPLRPNALVALAGVVVSGELISQSEASIRNVIDINLTSQIELAKLTITYWLKENIPGNIVFVSSWVDHVPWPGITPYAASKAGLVGVCRGVAREYATKGIRANLIAPGIVDVGMAAKQWREEPDYRARAARAIPLGRLQRPEEVASGIAFLLSSESKYMTGSTLLMDGGASLYPMDPEESR